MRRIHLFVAFAFTVMADPVSSVAYAIEAVAVYLWRAWVARGRPAGLLSTGTDSPRSTAAGAGRI